MQTKLALAVVVAGAALLVWALRPGEPAQPRHAAAQPTTTESKALAPPLRPTTPPVPGRDVPTPAPEPELPPNLDDLRLVAYTEALEQQDERPGERAFRVTVSAFIKHNRKFAEAQAQTEGLAVDEVEELTYFGLMAQESQRWGEVEAVLGRSVPAEQRAEAEALLHQLNADFKNSMRDLVADGGSAEDRWTLIRSFQQDYRDRYFDITGMDEALLDDVLAGDMSRKHAASGTPPPEDVPPREDDPKPVAPRPDGVPS